MIKRLLLIGYILPLFCHISAQEMQVDTLQKWISRNPNDTLKMVWLNSIARIYAEISPDSCYHYSEKALDLSRKLNLKLDESSALREMGYAMLNRGNYPRALQLMFSALEFMEDTEIEKNVLVGRFPGDDPLMHRQAPPRAQRLNGIAFTYQNLGILYANANNFEKSVHYHRLAKEKGEQSGNLATQSLVNLTMNRVYLQLNKTDSALITIQLSHEQMIRSGYIKYLGSALLNMGRTFAAMGNVPRAIRLYKESIEASNLHGYYRGIVAGSLLLADYYKQNGQMDSSFHYIRDAFAAAQYMDAPDLLLRNYRALANYYKATGKNDSVVKYQSLIIKTNDSLFNAKHVQQFQNIDFDEQQRKLQMEAAEKQFKARLQRNILMGSLATFFLVALLLWRNIRHRKKSAAVLQVQKNELEKTLENLKITQHQLIQSEKMASLGEMTAGIAHEIQNPLNFINNFSEVNNELIEEVKQQKSRLSVIELEELLGQIIQNNEKISQHGKRADAIVKGMLLHSRTSGGKKELTDINALCDEYLRLAYHGLRAKDKTFNAKFETDFDNSIDKINVVPQDIGRVVLNLINNAFYAVSHRKAELSGGGTDYEPTVVVSTKKHGKKIELTVKDNGNGIPDDIKEKIFQPFFTTKPAGQGTGLGLSLAYDIITKGHNGELRVNSEKGKGCEFIITLPYIS